MQGKARLTRDPYLSDSEAPLGALFEHLPVAIALFDGSGRFLLRSGALRSMLGDCLPSRDSRLSVRWQISLDDGSRAEPPDWPGARALRGETIIPGMKGLYEACGGEPRHLRISAMPFGAQTGAGGIALLQDLEPEKRGRDGLQDDLELRFVDALFRALATVCKDSNYREAAAAQKFVARSLAFAPELTSSLAPTACKTAQQSAAGIDSPATRSMLSEREAEVMKLIAWGKSQKDIAAQLGISIKTVQFHRGAAAARLRLRSRTDILRYALEQGWLN